MKKIFFILCLFIFKTCCMVPETASLSSQKPTVAQKSNPPNEIVINGLAGHACTMPCEPGATKTQPEVMQYIADNTNMPGRGSFIGPNGKKLPPDQPVEPGVYSFMARHKLYALEHIKQLIANGTLVIEEDQMVYDCTVLYKGNRFIACPEYRNPINNDIGNIRSFKHITDRRRFDGGFRNGKTLDEFVIMAMFFTDNVYSDDPSCDIKTIFERLCRVIDIIQRKRSCIGNDQLLLQDDTSIERDFLQFAYAHGLFTDEQNEYGIRFFDVLDKVRAYYYDELGLNGFAALNSRLFDVLTDELEKHSIDWREILSADKHAQGTIIASKRIMQDMDMAILGQERGLTPSDQPYVEAIVQATIFLSWSGS